ncbi:MAG TPA: nucleotidyltransferase domain-containing protein [Vicinamibacterales bacterium]|nr:nucleotidyltransferase domain-containing protein [Vicinamibacterales bacterium]
MGLDEVVRRRRREREALLARARAYAATLERRLALRAVAVFGSVARGDFNVWSDIDVLVVADHLPAKVTDRFAALLPWPAGVQPIAWTVDEWHLQLARRNRIAVEALERGVWLRGSPEELRGQ